MAYTTIDDPSAYFQVDLHTGDGSGSTETFDGNSDMQPDWLWFKSRSVTGDHGLVDTSRGKPSSNNSFFILKSNSSNGDQTVNSGSDFTAMNSDGYTYGGAHHLDLATNTSQNAVWGWKANGGTTTSNGASGDIKASVTQREDTAKFAICTYTGTGISSGQSHRVNHGLGTTPHVMMFKSRGASGDWVVYHHKNTDAPETDYLVLNEGNATADSANKFNDTAPNTSYATIGGDDNISSGTIVLYSFAEVQGYSKFGSFTGNGSTDGPFIYTGFKPAFGIFKRTNSTGQWYMMTGKIGDDGQDGNPLEDRLEANTTAAESDMGGGYDFVSNGIKNRHSGGEINGSGDSFIYMAFAHQPFVSSEGVPTTAR